MLALIATLAGSLIAPIPGDPPPRPNVIVILMDDIGRDKIACYGEHPAPPPTPNIDGLRDQGILFRNAWAYQTCSPTRAALMTGRYSDRTGIGDIIRAGDGVDSSLPFAEHILPEALPGYTSTMIGKWHLSDTGSSARHPIESGFDLYAGYQGSLNFFNWTQNLNGALSQQSGYLPVVLGGQVIRTVQHSESPSFVYYCPGLAHSPFHAPPPILHSQPSQPQSRITQHLAMVEALDKIVGRVLWHVDLDETYVFIIGDNGSPATTVTPPFSSMRAKRTMYEGGLRVPFLVAGPGIAAGGECTELVHIVDVFATVRELCGFDAPSQGAEDSVSMVPLLMDPTARGARSFLYARAFPNAGVAGPEIRALRTDRYKVIDFVTAGRVELYDLLADPHEATDLLTQAPGAGTDQIRDRLLALMP
jgi:arylsulfatase A-like enzyme